MSSQPSQPPTAHILKLAHIEILRLAEMARASIMASHLSQLGKAPIHILKTSLSENGESIKNVKSTKSTTESAYTNSESNPGRNRESVRIGKSTKSTTESAYTYIETSHL